MAKRSLRSHSQPPGDCAAAESAGNVPQPAGPRNHTCGMSVARLCGQPFHREWMASPLMLPSLKDGEWLAWITQLVEESGGICAPADLPRSSFYCRLAGQPDHLVPQWYFSHPPAHSPESETLFLNPTFFLNDGFSLLNSPPALFQNSFQTRIACIE